MAAPDSETSLVKSSVAISLLMLAEAFGLLWIGLRYLGLRTDDPALYTFSFLTLLFFAIFSILVVRRRRHFWSSRPSRVLLLGLGLDLVVGTVIGAVGIPGLVPLSVGQILTVLAYALVLSLLVNDMTKWLLVGRVGLRW